MVDVIEIEEQIKRTHAFACLECGKCTGVCPVSVYSREYSPRRLLNRTVRRSFDGVLQGYDLWSCLSCMRCDEVCMSGVHYSDLIQILRMNSREQGFNGTCSHAGALQSLSRIMTTEHLEQNRLEWVSEDMQTGTEGDVLYFVGCAPYFDVFFADLELSTLEAAKSSVRILNRLGITPVLLADERCCGHDLLWNGEVESFRALAKHNLEALRRSGAKTVLFSCAECQSAFQNLYREQGLEVKTELKHMSQFLAEKLRADELRLAELSAPVTYQDPCRLGRHLGVYEDPRLVLQDGSSTPQETGHFREMRQSGRSSLCCGVSGWMNCDVTSKAIQAERLKQAKATGAEIMAVACPKCQIHLTCALKDTSLRDQYSIRIQDISTLTLERMES